MKKTFLIAAVALFSWGAASAQEYTSNLNPRTSGLNNMFGLSWEIAIPTNNDFLDKTSLRGGKVEYRHFLPGKPISFGASLGWQSYEQYIPTQTITYDNGNKAITTDMDRVIYTVPIAAIGHYYFNYGKTAMPYLGVGVGAQYSEQTIYYNIFETNENTWGFLVRPEIGVLIRPGQANWGILAGASYSFATNKNSLFDQSNLKNVSFNIGLFLTN
ncbi:outer membrane protein with beta-barrel domain [Chitinophaga skermanii]|uniref:Outer membrane protein with beta-barrel domain n=1 Tax=Chitinophaga skermanii TaxID=331697 RepID=A0A327QSC1_9BACT|nr:outer membrane beta-barrel protein [Chitinophaga skermanii]RAJ06592.1 outer membrane protein with beta-barrel domain [Chitinophaga skermanii]